MRVLVTRPLHDARRWVDALRARGIDAAALPLIDIASTGPVNPPRPLAHYRAVMFVSGNAVTHFFKSLREPFTPRAWAPGPGTRDALVAAGVALTRIDTPGDEAAQFDSEALWQTVNAQVRPGVRVLVVRGRGAQERGDGRDWLARQIMGAGGEVEFLAVYERRPPPADEALRALARQAAADGTVWLFSSSEAIGNLQQMLPGQSWARARALATHPRIAQTARDAGFAVVCESRPALEEVVASIESFA